MAKNSQDIMYEFHWTHGPLVNSELLAEMSKLYSGHYGIWSREGPRPGHPIRLSPDQIRNWLVPDSLVVWTRAFGEMIGYAIAIHAQLPGRGKVAWITQLVVHRDHRKVDVGKRMLFTIWGFSDYFAWGLLSANPYAVRALEKATRRRCQPSVIAQHSAALRALGESRVHYLKAAPEAVIGPSESRCNTGFQLDHTKLSEMLASVIKDDKPWTLGNLPSGWEWFAFTFQGQEQIKLGDRELEEMLAASDRITKQAYERMQPQWKTHPWAKFAAQEVEFIINAAGIQPGASVLDFGCGDGRHVTEFAKREIHAMGVDYIQQSIDAAKDGIDVSTAQFARFHHGDCRSTKMSGNFNVGICLYDVIGSYADPGENMAILKNLADHLAPGGKAFISVMNMELTERIARHWFSISSQPDRLLSLPPSNIMERSGNVFDPDYFMIDRDTRVVYRKEQFREGEELFEELLVRDRRYTRQEIQQMCARVGLNVVWTRLVRAGHWNEPLDDESEKAKEILVMCEKPIPEDLQEKLFD